jgi:hypothetical protein
MPAEKFDRTLETVWEWRRKAQQEHDQTLESASPEDRAQKIHQWTENFLTENKLHLPRLSKAH